MKYLGLLTFIFCISSISRAEEIKDESKPDAKAVMKLIQEAADQTDPLVLELMKANLQNLQHIEEDRYIKMADVEMSSLALSCVRGKAGLVWGGSIGVCIDTNGKTYTLSSRTIGATFGSTASLIFGIVKFRTKAPGDYVGQSVGINNGIQRLKFFNAGFGVDVLYSKGKDTDNSLILAGPAIGQMFDISRAELTLATW
jgi:hypothetical protein